MYPQCIPWVSAPLPPVSVGLPGVESLLCDLIQCDQDSTTYLVGLMGSQGLIGVQKVCCEGVV